MSRLQLLVEALRGEKGPIVVLTGAGVSLASGIPTFRGSDPGAVWKRDITEMATLAYFRDDPVGSWQWYRKRFARLLEARPNPAHRALAALERWHLGRGGEFLLVAQNIDTLHEQAGSERLVKVHGSADRVRCSAEDCSLGSLRSLPLSGVSFGPFDSDPKVETIPRCPDCGALLRPHVLWFDELYLSHVDYQWERVTRAMSRMRLLLCAGTSFAVGVTELARESALASNIPCFVVDPGEDAMNAPGSVHLQGKAEELLPAAAVALGLPVT